MTTSHLPNSNATTTQTSKLTITNSSGGGGDDESMLLHKMLAFSDLDRLALELSELSSLSPSTKYNTASTQQPPTITNQQCSYLLTQFETFARQFNKTNRQSGTSFNYNNNKNGGSSSSCSFSSSSSSLTKYSTISNKSKIKMILKWFG